MKKHSECLIETKKTKSGRFTTIILENRNGNVWEWESSDHDTSSGAYMAAIRRLSKRHLHKQKNGNTEYVNEA